MKRIIYAEWKHEGKFDNGFFASWEQFHTATFSPDYEVLTAREVAEPEYLNYYKGIPAERRHYDTCK